VSRRAADADESDHCVDEARHPRSTRSGALVIAFAMIAVDEFRASEMAFAERHHPIKTFL
jgi:hypothetical protein